MKTTQFDYMKTSQIYYHSMLYIPIMSKIEIGKVGVNRMGNRGNGGKAETRTG